MTNPLDRLSGADPAAAGYAPRDLDALVTRVVRSRAPRDPAWRLFRLRVAGAASAAALLTGAGVVALGAAGTALPVLSFAAPATPNSTAAGSQFATSVHAPKMMLPLQRDYSFSAGPSLSSAAGSATVYSLAPALSGATPLTAAARTLGLAIGAPTATDSTDYVSYSEGYTGWLTDFAGYASWGIQSTSPAATSSTSDLQTNATDAFNATAVADARSLGADPGTPSAVTLATDPEVTTEVSVPVLVDGLATPFTNDFEFGADGTLLGADGVSVATTALGDYPLLSPADAVGQIPSQRYLVPPGVTEGLTNPFATVGGASSGATPPVNPPADGSGSSAPSVTAPSTVAPPSTDPSTEAPDATTTSTTPAIPVTITGVTERYGVYAMTDGSTLLLPVYDYTGTDPSGLSLEFSVIPVDPSYLDLSRLVRAMLY